jgi:threonine dehydratase
MGLHQDWNISLFHYRNHGAGRFCFVGPPNTIITKLALADLGKVLAGIQVPASEYQQFDEYLTKLDYTYVEETQNEVYRRYLRG